MNPFATPDNPIAQPFDHPKNITVGKGRVIFVEDAGWALPGGEFTADPERAQRVAQHIDACSA